MEIRNPARLDKDNQAREMASDVTPCAHNPGERSDTRGKFRESTRISLRSCGLQFLLPADCVANCASTI